MFGSYQLSEDMLLNFSVENITDQYYFGALASAGIPSPGRTARLGLTATLGEATWSFPELNLGNAAEGTPGSNWGGLYVGGHLGYGFADINGNTTSADGTPGGIPATESADLNVKDLTRGFQVGLNHQFAGGLVIGVEGDFSWMKLSETQEARVTEDPSVGERGFLQAKTDYELEWMASLRGRIGYAFDRTLLYATGGLAYLHETQVRSQYQADVGSETLPAGRSTSKMFSESASATRRGWTVGAGFEYALTNHWSLKGEYLYADFGEEDFSFSDARAGVSRPYTIRCTPRPCTNIQVPGTSDTVNGRKASNELDLHTLKLGVNYRF